MGSRTAGTVTRKAPQGVGIKAHAAIDCVVIAAVLVALRRRQASGAPRSAEADTLATAGREALALLRSASPGLSAPPVDCTNSCWSGPCNCSGKWRPATVSLAADEVRPLLERYADVPEPVPSGTMPASAALRSLSRLSGLSPRELAITTRIGAGDVRRWLRHGDGPALSELPELWRALDALVAADRATGDARAFLDQHPRARGLLAGGRTEALCALVAETVRVPGA